MIIIFVIIAATAAMSFLVFSYVGEIFLGTILGVIMLCWPTIFWLMSKVFDNYGLKPKIEIKGLKQDIIGEDEENLTAESKSEESIEEEFAVRQKKDENLTNAKEGLEKLKKASDLLDEEKNEGLLSEDAYNELKKQNKETIEKLEEEIAKASGEIEKKKVYCKKGKHYISERDCLPSKIKGYVICQEHNEEIRVE